MSRFSTHDVNHYASTWICTHLGHRGCLHLYPIYAYLSSNIWQYFCRVMVVNIMYRSEMQRAAGVAASVYLVACKCGSWDPTTHWRQFNALETDLCSLFTKTLFLHYISCTIVTAQNSIFHFKNCNKYLLYTNNLIDLRFNFLNIQLQLRAV